jgi:hypothetical protein
VYPTCAQFHRYMNIPLIHARPQAGAFSKEDLATCILHCYKLIHSPASTSRVFVKVKVFHLFSNLFDAEKMSDQPQTTTADPALCMIPPFSEAKDNTIRYLPVCTGAFSLVGSSLILLSIYRRGRADKQQGAWSSASIRRSTYSRQRRRGQTSHVYHRIMIAMSIYDIMFTLFSCMFGVLLNPRDNPFELYRAHGTRFTCTLQGFFVQWGYGSFAYGAWLNVYYVMTIRYNVQEAFLARYVEPIIHSTVFVFYFGTALTASLLGFMNPLGFGPCYFAPYPRLCVWVDYCPCIRGEHVQQAVLWMVLVPSSVSVAAILVCLGLVAATVWQQRRVMREQDRRLRQNIVSTRVLSSEGAESTPPSAFLTGSGANEHEKSSQSILGSTSAPMSTKPSSSLDRLAKEAIAQSVFSGFTFVNSVLWTNLVYAFFVKEDVSGISQFWVCICAVRFVCSSCSR